MSEKDTFREAAKAYIAELEAERDALRELAIALAAGHTHIQLPLKYDPEAVDTIYKRPKALSLTDYATALLEESGDE